MVWSMDRRDAVRPTYLGLVLLLLQIQRAKWALLYYKSKLENTNSKMLPRYYFIDNKILRSPIDFLSDVNITVLTPDLC